MKYLTDETYGIDLWLVSDWFDEFSAILARPSSPIPLHHSNENVAFFDFPRSASIESATHSSSADKRMGIKVDCLYGNRRSYRRHLAQASLQRLYNLWKSRQFIGRFFKSYTKRFMLSSMGCMTTKNVMPSRKTFRILRLHRSSSTARWFGCFGLFECAILFDTS